MKLYRLSKEKYKDDLSGKGAERYGGRWNTKGMRMVYTSDSRALAKLEVAVHVSLNRLPRNYYMVTINIPDRLISTYESSMLKGKNWKNNPPIKFTQSEGDGFLRNKEGLALRVPSAVVQGDYNILINPEHPDIKKTSVLQVEKFDFDIRLFK
ncbi:RES family NAD+ phosphorylase [Costertonia aggregata]|uniref:RES family NAD+ phosphorylase n=1 Tax=Costertonia aggregata TaxID=343403 RepID=A0A7H9APU4_9FLAO|nr:RES family NAD+ phosphorylase [Costertonia aggregata]QLG45413.1 RES family NAD+ phosphorylase [Costertonia aggregata]